MAFVEEVRQHAAEAAPGRRSSDGRSAATSDVSRIRRGLRGCAERCAGVGDQDREVDRLAPQGEAAGLDERERPQILDQPVERPDLVEDGREVLGVGRVDAVHGSPRAGPG